jgi:hypothetical protein
MIEFLLASTLSASQAHAIQNKEDVNKVCAYIVGIPYASDNFSDNQWNRFVLCKDILNQQ